jgi:hypothetical protein
MGFTPPRGRGDLAFRDLVPCFHAPASCLTSFLPFTLFHKPRQAPQISNTLAGDISGSIDFQPNPGTFCPNGPFSPISTTVHPKFQSYTGPMGSTGPTESQPYADIFSPPSSPGPFKPEVPSGLKADSLKCSISGHQQMMVDCKQTNDVLDASQHFSAHDGHLYTPALAINVMFDSIMSVCSSMKRSGALAEKLVDFDLVSIYIAYTHSLHTQPTHTAYTHTHTVHTHTHAHTHTAINTHTHSDTHLHT